MSIREALNFFFCQIHHSSYFTGFFLDTFIKIFPYSNIINPKFFSGAFMALYITFVSLIYLEFILACLVWRASKVSLVVKNLPANAEDKRDTGLIPGWGRSPGVGNGNPLQYSCLENSMGRGDWWAIIHGVTKKQTCDWVTEHIR